jgi:hypothetical protein
MQGFPEKIWRKLFYRNSLNFNDDKRSIDLSIFIKQAERIVSSKQKFKNFSKRFKERGKFDNFIKQFKIKPDVSEGRVLQILITSPFITAENEPKDISLNMNNSIN